MNHPLSPETREALAAVLELAEERLSIGRAARIEAGASSRQLLAAEQESQRACNRVARLLAGEVR